MFATDASRHTPLTSSLTLPRWGTWGVGELWALGKSGLRSDATDGGAGQNWPTPDAAVMNDGEHVATTLERRERLRLEKLNGNGFGLRLTTASLIWPTPDANHSAYSNGFMGPNLREAAATWPTPRARDEKGAGYEDTLGAVSDKWATPKADAERHGPNQVHGTGSATLPNQADKWATPNVPNGSRKPKDSDLQALVENRGMTPLGERQVGLENQAAVLGLQAQAMPTDGEPTSPDTPDSPPRRLNPAFVEALQGVPHGWTDCESSATDSYQQWQRRFSER